MKKIMIIAIITASFHSCSLLESENEEDNVTSENSDSTTEEIENSNYFGLQVGNWWVYKNYKLYTSTGEYYETGVIDSINVIDTLKIDNELYYAVKTKTTGNEDNINFCNPNGEYLENYKVLNGELIKDDGTVVFSTTNFEESFFQQIDNATNIYESSKPRNINRS